VLLDDLQVITGTPVGTPEMDRDCGLPLTEAELACVPTFGKAGTVHRFRLNFDASTSNIEWFHFIWIV
jgi:hypothetical protein